jgi:hypothetical protein
MNIELFPLLVAKVGDRERVATPEDIADVHAAIVNALTTDGILVTHHAVQFEVVQVPVATPATASVAVAAANLAATNLTVTKRCPTAWVPTYPGCCPVCCGDCPEGSTGCVEPVILGVDEEGNLIYQADEADEASVEEAVDNGDVIDAEYVDSPSKVGEQVAGALFALLRDFFAGVDVRGQIRGV